MHKLNYISENVLADLKANVPSNLERYRSTGFEDKTGLNGWSMALNSVEFDPDKLADLDPATASASEWKNRHRISSSAGRSGVRIL